MDKLTVAEARRAEAVGREALVQGWVRTRRDCKAGFSFLELNDGSCFGNVQVVAAAALENYESEIKRLTAGCSVSVEGLVKASPGKGQATEVQARSVTVHGWADPETYPLQKKQHSFEFLRTVAHLRPRTNTFGAVARVRNCVCRSIHDFFQEEGFLYVHTPIITASDCEGAGEMFQVTTLDLNNVPMPVEGSYKPDWEVDFSQDFFERPAYLTVSGQLEAETFACSLGKVYTFGPTFRAENSNTTRHLAEFWMVEPEMAFFELADNMDLAERFLKRIVRDVLEKCPEDMEFFRQRIDATVVETLQHVVASSFVPPALHRGHRGAEGLGAAVRVSRPVGQRPPGRARALADRDAFPVAGDPLRLSAHDQAVLHASERRRPHGAGDGRAGAEGRRDHRRQPARASPRGAGDADEGAGLEPGELLVVSRPAALRHGAAQRFWPGRGAGAFVCHRHDATSAT